MKSRREVLKAGASFSAALAVVAAVGDERPLTEDEKLIMQLADPKRPFTDTPGLDSFPPDSSVKTLALDLTARGYLEPWPEERQPPFGPTCYRATAKGLAAIGRAS